MAGAIALPLLALCTPALSSAVESAQGAALLHVAPSSEHAAAELPAPPVEGESVLMSCDDASGLPALAGQFTALPSASPLWCEDTDSGSHCSPAAPEPPHHDFGHASFALLGLLPHLERPALLALDTRVTPHVESLRGCCVHARLDRPPRA